MPLDTLTPEIQKPIGLSKILIENTRKALEKDGTKEFTCMKSDQSQLALRMFQLNKIPKFIKPIDKPLRIDTIDYSFRSTLNTAKGQSSKVILEAASRPRTVLDRPRSPVKSKSTIAQEPEEYCGIKTNSFNDLQQLGQHISSVASQLRMKYDPSEFEATDLISHEIVKRKSTMVMPILTAITDEVKEEQGIEFIKCNIDSLPFDMDPKPYLRTSLYCKAIKKSQRDRWKITLTTKPSTDLIISLFWFVWSKYYGKAKEMEIFNHISLNYVSLFLNYKEKDKDLFFQEFPYIASHAIFLVFSDGFPNLNEQFNNSFKDKSSKLIHSTLSGLQPTVLDCENWQPKTQETAVEEVQIDSKLLLGNLLISKKHLNTPINLTQVDTTKEKKAAIKNVRKKDTSVIGEIRKSKMVPFNVYQKSPLIQFYLNNHGQRVEQKSLNIRRCERVFEQLPVDSLTYDQVIKDSLKKSNSRYAEFQSNIEDLSKERIKIIEEANTFFINEQSRAMKILNRPTSIKYAADIIVENYLTGKTNRRTPFNRVPIFE